MEDFEHIGERLKSAREAADFTVDDVVFRTRVPRSVVEALEAEDFSVFASPVYAKSFLSLYSEFLNVDAQPWLEALEPGSFMPGGQLYSLFDGPEEHSEERAPVQESRGGILSILGLLSLSAVVVLGAIKGYQFFEKRLGEESPSPVSKQEVPPVYEGVRTEGQPEVVPEPKAVAEREDEEIAKPPPRAIIVR